MSDQSIGQILQAFNSIESKLKEQHSTLKMLTAKVEALEAQNKQLIQMLHQQQHATPSSEQADRNKVEFQHAVTQSLRSIEDKSKKTIELIKTTSGKTRKRAWP